MFPGNSSLEKILRKKPLTYQERLSGKRCYDMEAKQNWTEQRRGRMGLPFQAKYTLFAKAYGAWLAGGTKELSVAAARRTLRKGKGGDRQSGLVRAR